MIKYRTAVGDRLRAQRRPGPNEPTMGEVVHDRPQTLIVKHEPCPFCASTAVIMRSSTGDERTGYHERFQMTCSHCYASTAAATYYPFPQDRREPNAFTNADQAKAAALAAWNRRTPT